MRPWQRNRIILVVLILAAVVTANIPALTTNQILSLVALYAVIFFLYVRYFNRY